MITIIHYPKCSTCQKAIKFLKENNIDFKERDIVLDNPNKKEIKEFLLKNNEINKYFNTSGILYRELNLKDKIKTMSEEEKINILSSNGKLIKRPLLILDDNILIGFKVKEWEKALDIN